MYHILLLSLILTPSDNITNQIPSTQPVTSQRYAKSNWQERADFEKYFQQAGVKGSFVLYNLKKNQYLAYNPKRVNTAFLPASTFKIFNSLVALETGVIKDENQVIKWDGVKREIEEWNQDQTMRSAIKYSTVWFYQELARRIGEKQMQNYINLVNYGNRNISGGIDKFWLEGGLRITSKQQIDFLVKLYRNQLPFSKRSINIVKDILINEKNNNYVLHGKTGLVGGVTPKIGWYVGYLERKNDVYLFAINQDVVKPDDLKARIAITKRILSDMGLLK